jgi:hypothetical protein
MAGAQQIYLVAKGKLKAVPVKLGTSDGKSTAITGAGLKPGDSVMIRATTSASLAKTPTTGPQRMPRM